MIPEKKVRTKIKACKKDMKEDKQELNTKGCIAEEIFKANICLEKAKLKHLRRELPARPKAVVICDRQGKNPIINSYICPICGATVDDGQNYCHYCGQRLERTVPKRMAEWLDKMSKERIV